MRPILAVAFLLFGAWASAQSQPPSPGSGKRERSQPNNQSASTQQPTSADPRGTNESPLIVKVQPAPKTDAETAKEQQKEQDEASAKWWTIGLAVITAFVGFLQVVLVSVQAYIAWRQNKIIGGQSTILEGQKTSMEDGLAIAREQTAITKRQNEIIETQTTHMATGLKIAAQQAKLAVAQTKIALASKRNMDRQTQHMAAGLDVARINAEAARIAAGATAKAVEDADRPWLKVWLGEVRKTEFLEGEIVFHASVVIENVGRGAAQYVMLYLDAIPRHPSLDVEAEQLRAFNNPSFTDGLIETILPNGSTSRMVTSRLRWEDIAKAQNRASVEDRNSWPIEPLIFGCARYTHGQTIHGSKLPKQQHHSIFAYRVGWTWLDTGKQIDLTLNVYQTLTGAQVRADLWPATERFSYAD